MKASSVSLDHLVTDLKAVARDSEELLRASRSDLGDAAGAFRDRLARSIESAKVTCQRLQEKTFTAAKRTNEALHDHPYQAAGVAFGMGLLIGVLVMRRPRSSSDD